MRAGAPESFVMQITGHRTTSMFRRYNIVTPTDMRAALRLRREYVASSIAPENLRTFPESAQK